MKLHYFLEDSPGYDLPEHKPVIRGIRVDDTAKCSYNDMVNRQFYAYQSTEILYVAILIENPFYQKDEVRIKYRLGLKFEGHDITNVHDTADVRMDRHTKFCVASAEIVKPREVKGMDKDIFNYRVYVTEEGSSRELAGVDFQIVKGPEIDVYYELVDYLTVLELKLYDIDAQVPLDAPFLRGSGLNLGASVKLKFKHEHVLPEIDFRLIITDDKEGIPLRHLPLVARPSEENGETVYTADGLLLDKGTAAALHKGKYSCVVMAWGAALEAVEFEVSDQERDIDSAVDELIDELGGSIIGGSIFGDECNALNTPPPSTPGTSAADPVAHEYLTLNSLDLYTQKYIDSLEPGEPAEGYTTFIEGFDDDLFMNATFDIHKKLEDPASLPLNVFLYDSTGRLLDNNVAECQIIDSPDNKQILYTTSKFRKAQVISWKKGMYKIEASLWDETLISIRFEICDVETRGTFDPIASQPRIGQGGRKIVGEVSDARKRLDEMIGIQRVKDKINSLRNVNIFNQLRVEAGLPVKKTPLHACFIGPPGTGKTTVAGIIGQIYHEMGLLSKGHVVYEDRGTLTGRYYDSEQREVERALRNAQGGVLFIDEAYSLYVEGDDRDPGHKVIEALLTALSDESNRDWMLVLAGYPDDIEKLLSSSNRGLESRVKDKFYFDGLSEDELLEVADLYCSRNEYRMTPEARRAVESVISRAYATRTDKFGNARYVNEDLMDKQVIPAMATRLKSLGVKPTAKQLSTIEKEDVPVMIQTQASKKLDELNGMIGLDELKQSITSHLNYVQMLNMRMNHGLYTSMPPLHMVFCGNPGTGKSTVAEFMGEIYASMGLLSHGEVIKVEKRDMVGAHVGETEKKMDEIIDRARGNVLFIEEAHQLWSADSDNDYGKVALTSLLATIANDKLDMIVVLAGYTDEMKRLLAMDKGMASRFPNIFEFEDYSEEELMEIAELTIERENFVLSDEAREKLEEVIRHEVENKTESFGNARFVNRLISTRILPAMGGRLKNLGTVPTKEQLMTIEASDIPSDSDKDRDFGDFDEGLIASALERLDSMVGLGNVKRTIHDFVDVSRVLKNERRQIFGNHLMKWNFVGNSGTGKSTVARIMADLLKAMGLIDSSNVVEIKGEEYYNVGEYRCDEILRKAMEKSKYGLLFVDSDAPMFRNPNQWTLTGDQLRVKLAALTAEIGGNGAIVIAENESPRHNMVQSLAENGIFNFDKTLIFEDYTAEELFEILLEKLREHCLEFSVEAADKMRAYICALCNNRSLSLANARTMKLLAESILEINLLRLCRENDAVKGVVTLDDVDSFEWRKPLKKIGF